MQNTRKLRSVYWNYFTKTGSGSVQCKHCPTKLALGNSSSSNLCRHLRRKHNHIFCKIRLHAKKDPLLSKKIADDSTETYLKEEVNKRIFEKVRSYCVALVKECGRPIEIMDDVPFKNLLKLIVRDCDREHLTAAAIKDFMETRVDAVEDTTLDETAQDDDEQDLFANIDDGDSDYEPPQSADKSHKRGIKNEKVQCVCQVHNEDGSGDHEIGCPLLTAQHYWSYFEVSVEDARCKECHSNVKWTTMADLKSHLDVFHAHLPYTEDDDVFTEPIQETALSEAGSYTDQPVAEEVTIDSLLTPKPPSAKNKRKLPAFSTKKCVTLKDDQTITLDRFKCLDRFGLYIAALLKMIPEDKCIKYQEQIVSRLLREQAAAG